MRGAVWLSALAMAGVVGIGAARAQAPVSGYLAAGETPDSVRLLPPPPARGSGREANDRAIFDATRALRGQPRWALATSDADLHPARALDDFACALGVRLDAQTAPTVLTLLRRTAWDAKAIVDPAKDHYARPRPYLSAPAGTPICVPKTDSLAKSPSYPSGHAAQSWAWGLILAELAPDRASEILMRARSLGESRIVCGVHYLSDVEAGRDAGAALVARLHADPAFRADLDKAGTEIEAARRSPHAAPGDCLVQDRAAAHPPY